MAETKPNDEKTPPASESDKLAHQPTSKPAGIDAESSTPPLWSVFLTLLILIGAIVYVESGKVSVRPLILSKNFLT
ncbi:hypothetical protein QUF90_01615 [Desulfococcaceae bacterium HSG9]|nr:hypothetical protein [Desulfococcaceae bacterium HSG9]